MQIVKLQEFQIPYGSWLKYTECGNTIELMYQEHKSNGNNIKKLSKDTYVDTVSGEIKEYQHTITRAQGKNELRRTFKKIRDLVNCNTTEVEKCKWVTLTYRENMQDTVKLYKDVKNYIKRLRYVYGKFEYIQVIEPQARGAWHVHVIFIFPTKAPYISNKRMQEIWGHGYTDTQKLQDNDNIGAYLSAYLGDIELNPTTFKKYKKNNPVEGYMDVKTVTANNSTKKYIKGGRLYYYPTGINIYRCSRGVKRPTSKYLKDVVAFKKVANAKLTYQSTIELLDLENDYSNKINYQYYNTKRK